MAYENVLYEKKGHIAYITLDRPAVLNAMNNPLIGDLMDALRDYDEDPEMWVAILNGAGRTFSAGADVKQHFARGELPNTPRNGFLGRTQNWKPVIAAVHGYVYGIGLILATECDLIVAAEGTRFSIAEVKRGLGGGGVWARVYWWMPSKVATEMVLTGDDLDAEDAYRLGLVNRLVPEEQLMSTAEALAERILQAPPLSVRSGVRATRLPVEDLQRATALASLGGPRFAETDDFKEGARAFVEKRKPVWTGR